MKIFPTLIAGAALIVASSAAAQSPSGALSTDGFYIDGYIDLSYIDIEGFDIEVLTVDLDMGYRPPTSLSGLPLGVSLGIDGFSFKSSGISATNTSLYPAITFGSGNHIFSAGIPRSVLDRGYLSEHIFAQSTFRQLAIDNAFNSTTSLVYRVFEETPYGLRWDGDLGSVKVGASWHRFSFGTNDFNAYALAFRHKMDVISSFPQLEFFGGMEYVDVPSGSISNYQLGIEGGTEKIMAGFVYKTGDHIAGTPGSAAQAYVEYSIRDNLKVDISIAHVESRTPYGIGIEYGFFNNAYANLSVFHNTGSSNSPSWEASVGWKF